MVAREKIRWAPKIQPQLVQRLYESDAAGLIDELLLEDVGLRLLLRCESIMMGSQCEVGCPVCGERFSLVQDDASGGDNPVACPGEGCSWSVTLSEYKDSRRHRDLGEGAALVAFEQYVKGYAAARSAAEKMLAVDRLIHAFHWDLKDKVPNRLAANNLMEGSQQQVCDFLDQLSARDAGAKAQWRQTVQWMYRRRRNQGNWRQRPES